MFSHSILVVEDSIETQIVILASLSQKYSVNVIGTAREAKSLLQANSYSVIILDVGLPDGDGFNICAELKQMNTNMQTPVIFLTGKSQISDKVLGLTLGADDYITKPFDPMELKARVDSKIRRLEENRKANDCFSIGHFRISSTKQKGFSLHKNKELDLDLTTTEFKILFLLLQHEDQIFTRDQILDKVWGPNINVNDRTVDSHIYTLRKKLGDLAGCIQAIPREGFRYSQNNTAKLKPSAA